ncbi:hypothetical protein CMV_008231, partial [Castanea mollissima]
SFRLLGSAPVSSLSLSLSLCDCLSADLIFFLNFHAIAGSRLRIGLDNCLLKSSSFKKATSIREN